MNKRKVRQVVLPLITAIIWGSSFVTQSIGTNYLGCFSFNALRSVPAALSLLLLLCIMQRVRPREKYSAEEKRALLRGGLVCGVLLTLGVNLQQFGMNSTSAGKAGFITALYIVLVPVFSIALGKRAGKRTWLCVAIALAGLYFLCFDGGSTVSLNGGDFSVLPRRSWLWITMCRRWMGSRFPARSLSLRRYFPALGCSLPANRLRLRRSGAAFRICFIWA